jgi:hypothetical protein
MGPVGRACHAVGTHELARLLAVKVKRIRPTTSLPPLCCPLRTVWLFHRHDSWSLRQRRLLMLLRSLPVFTTNHLPLIICRSLYLKASLTYFRRCGCIGSTDQSMAAALRVFPHSLQKDALYCYVSYQKTGTEEGESVVLPSTFHPSRFPPSYLSVLWSGCSDSI